MENWGAITFHCACLERLPGEDWSKYFRDCRTLCHEISHMWFGNLVTMLWWNDLWLNEGFARFMEFKCLHAVRGEFNVWARFVADVMYAVLAVDFPIARTHPVEIPCVNPDLIHSYFDNISYLKGASLLRMLESMMGEEEFDEAIRQYLNKFKGGSVVSRDFFQVMGEHCKYPVQDIMETWTQQPGFPLVTVSRVDKRSFSVKQTPYDKKGQEVWKIPVRFVTDTEETGMILLEEREGVIETKSDAAWIKINHASTGFFRVLYEDYAEIFQGLRSLQIEDRYGIVNDFIAHFNNGLIDISYIEKLVDAIVPEFNYSIILMVTNLVKKQGMLGLLPEQFSTVLTKLLFPLWEKYGIREVGEDFDFTVLKNFYCINLLEYCRNKIVAGEIISEINSSGKYSEFKETCLLCLTDSQQTLDRVCDDNSFRRLVLEESNDSDLLRFAIEEELKGKDSSEISSILRGLITFRSYNPSPIFIEALLEIDNISKP